MVQCDEGENMVSQVGRAVMSRASNEIIERYEIMERDLEFRFAAECKALESKYRNDYLQLRERHDRARRMLEIQYNSEVSRVAGRSSPPNGETNS